MESFSCVIALYFMTSKGTLKRFEQGLGQMRKMRITHYHEKYDDFSRLRFKTFLLKVPILVFFLGSAGFLVTKKMVIFGTSSTSSWYPYVDAGIAVLCAYVNFIYLPVHGLMHHALAREFEVFNEELESASKNKELVNPQTFQKFADRQIKLFEVTNRITERLNGFMSSAPFLIFTALANVAFIVTKLRIVTPTFYYVCLIGMMICCIAISSNLLYPPAAVQEAMLHTSKVLMNDAYLHHSQDPQIYSTYRIMVDRAQNNRSVNLVVQIFSVNKKNIERAYFVITNIVLVMAVFQNILFGSS
uniref:Gustatory receptor n=1 Tax=Caenorhabditis tropicalis TaxID=1561998 RepID=A0A1I7TI81_9PELO